MEAGLNASSRHSEPTCASSVKRKGKGPAWARRPRLAPQAAGGLGEWTLVMGGGGQTKASGAEGAKSSGAPPQRYVGGALRRRFTALIRQSLLVEQQRLHAAVFEFWYLVGDDLRQHLGELHAERLVHEGVEADLEKTLHHLEEAGRSGVRGQGSGVIRTATTGGPGLKTLLHQRNLFYVYVKK
ncbi:hypothetical protein EYF80_058162 [Liparis tanakae]|uniref:Uncharacterized protein n=1 Tax=Liparis tanakae TaxID=230148 RepID=A0A4Z2ESS0_9TELE|nr:hypothetical protein EYF80_058162 [Liparis tanakae]